MPRKPKVKPFEIYRRKEAKVQYSWRTTANTGDITGTGGEGYHNYLDCLNGARVTRDILIEEIAKIEAKLASLTQVDEGEK